MKRLLFVGSLGVEVLLSNSGIESIDQVPAEGGRFSVCRDGETGETRRHRLFKLHKAPHQFNVT